MRPIQIDDEVFAHLQSKSTNSFEDTPNTVLRKLFKLRDLNKVIKTAKRKRAKK